MSDTLQQVTTSYNNAVRNVKEEVVECTFSRYDKSASYTFSQSDIGRTCRSLLEIPKEAIKGIDSALFRRIKIYLKDGYRADSFKVAESRILRPGLRLEPMLRPDHELTVRLFWTEYDDDNTEIMAIFEQFGRIVSEIEYVKFQESGNEDADYIRGIESGDRTFKMLLTKSIPCFVLLGRKRMKCWHPGQVKTCPRCHCYPDKCLGGADANRCRELDKENKRQRRLDPEVWRELCNEAPNLQAAHEIKPDYLEVMCRDIKVHKDMMEFLTNNGAPELAVKDQHVVKTGFPGVWRVINISPQDVDFFMKELNGLRFRREVVVITPVRGDYLFGLKADIEEVDESEDEEDDDDQMDDDGSEGDDGDGRFARCHCCLF